MRGLTKDDRVEELAKELQGLEWDVITINETKRSQKREFWTMHGGHIFMGSGYDLPTRGVAIILHQKWKPYVKQFHPVNERIAYVDIARKKFRIRIVAAYFPHSGYEDEHIENMYEILGNIRIEAKQKGLQFVMGADCNAQVGVAQEDDDPRVIGQFGMRDANGRGEWLKNWATAHSLAIVNTCFEKPVEKTYTFVGPSRIPRQIDFFLVSRKVRGWTRDCETTREIDMGSDHKMLKMRISFQEIQRTSLRKQRSPERLRMKWPPTSLDEYKRNLTKRLEDLTVADQPHLECKQIEGAIVDVMATIGQDDTETRATTSRFLEDLVQKRRSLPHADQRGRSQYTKLIRKEVRAIKRTTRRSQIARVLNEYKNLKFITGIKTRRQQELIPSMVTKDGREVHERQSIADVFASFYGELYGDEDRRPIRVENSRDDAIVDLSLDELKFALKLLKNGKAADENRICAEMLKFGGERLCVVMLQEFNNIIKPSSPIPKEWSKTLIKVLHKNGDARLPQNYRPIATIPLLYKLFSRMIYNRLEPILDPQQSRDQAGFRRNRSTVEHLFTTTIIQETAEEWKYPLWMAAVDFKKAFDSVTHYALWQALSDQGVPRGYINLLDKLYDKQVGMVKTEKLSKQFSIQKGVKQGDPLSSLLFNSVSEHIMRPLKERWETKKYGINMGETKGTLTNLRFADDILLVSHSLASITQMLEDLSRQARMVGLSLHPDKTKILRNKWSSNRHVPSHARADGMEIEIMKIEGHTKYLGRKLTFQDPSRSEVENRIALAWKKFHAQKQELTGKAYSLNDRLRLFNGTIMPTILYGSETWTTTKEIEQRIKTTQRQMLRMIVRVPRRVVEPSGESAGSDVTSEGDSSPEVEIEAEAELEPWSEWIQRATHEAENRMRQLNIQDWVSLQRSRKWKSSRQIATCTGDSWILDALTWDPYPRWRMAVSRRIGRPTKRWSDDVKQYFYRAVLNASNNPSMNPRLDNVGWLHHARDEAAWAGLEDGYRRRE